MAGEEIAKYGLNSTIGKPNFRPLDKIIAESTSISIQTITFNFTDSRTTLIQTINPVNTSKTIMHIPYLVKDSGIEGLSFEFLDEERIRGTVSLGTADKLTVTMQLITLGGELV